MFHDTILIFFRVFVNGIVNFFIFFHDGIVN
jgi:hypothetical protein